MKSIRFVWLALFVLFLGAATYFAEQIFFKPRPEFPKDSIEWHIHQDIKSLADQRQLPSAFESIHEVFTIDRRAIPEKINWKDISKYDFPQKSNGKYDLQIEVFSTEDPTLHMPDTKKDRESVILQMSLFEKDSKNKIWELSRTYEQKK